MPLGNWRDVQLVGPYAIKTPRKERELGGLFLNRWEHEMWTVWQPKFGWPHLCPVVWCDPAGYILVMQRVIRPASDEEIRAFEVEWMDKNVLPLPSAEDKAADWGYLADGHLWCATTDTPASQKLRYNASARR
jgi:hypothetical protein